MAIITVDRKYKKSEYTIGRLSFEGQFICNTLEDTDRNLTQDSPLALISMTKKLFPKRTAIPSGLYKITLEVVSPKYSNYTKYPFARAIKARMPRLCSVPGYDGVLIHPGNTDADTEGCILVGKNDVKGKVTNSQYWFKTLYDLILPYKSDLWVDIR